MQLQLYRNSLLSTLLPKCLALCGNETQSDARGIPLPPFFIKEKGESLDEWSCRAEPDTRF